MQDKKPATPPPTPGPKGPPPGVPMTPTPSTVDPSARGTAANGSTGGAADAGTNGDATEGADKAANRSKLFIVVGEVHEFPTAAKAEAFLNQPNGPKQFVVIRGHKVESKQKVTLR